MPKRTSSTNQLPLGLKGGDPHEPAFECRGVFAPGYLQKHRRLLAENLPEDTREHYDVVRRLWEENHAALRIRKEAYTRSHFLDPVLKKMGWSFVPEADIPKAVKFSDVERPDYCLFASETIQRRAATKSGEMLYRLSSSLLEAKRTGDKLDQVPSSKRRQSKRQKVFPSQQVQNYLHHARDERGNPFFNWIILTNAEEWRLYTDRAAFDACFIFRLVQGDDFCKFEDFKLFWTLFGPVAFDRGENKRCQLDDIQDESIRLKGELEKNLRVRIFDVLEDLANGFRDNTENEISEGDYKVLYDTALIYLYRLLFILYAESRGLLPVKPQSGGTYTLYRDKYSLARLIERLRDGKSYPSSAFHDLYDELDKLFDLINGTHPEQNKALNITRYNGGLFHPENHPRIKQWKVADPALAAVLRQLIFVQPPASGRRRQQQISTGEAIDYSTLEVRQLGDIYEGLLGAKLVLEDSRLALKNENGENHRQGIYYTPDWVVNYLVRETLQALLAEFEEQTDVQAAKRAKSEEKSKDNSFAQAVLGLNIVDPAMGSGHFLVRATEWLAYEIWDHPTTRTMTKPADGRTNSQTQFGKDENLTAGLRSPQSSSQEQAEIAFWRRAVVESCIYGVDTNPMAVELAKLSLWLTCIASDEPLSFLDHHLRPGNSLLFADPGELSRLGIGTPEVEDEQTQPFGPFVLGDRITPALAAAIVGVNDIESRASTEMEAIKFKEARWKKVRGGLKHSFDVADLWTAALAGLEIDDFQYRAVARLLIEPDAVDTEEHAEANRWLKAHEEELLQKKQALQAFHWRLEFPQVFYEEDGRPLTVERAGFDAILGNPPYISTHTGNEPSRTGKAQKPLWREALEKRAGYLDDLYVHFTDLGFRHLLRPGGGFGFIVSDTFFTLASKESMRGWLQENTLTHLGQCDPFDATVDAAIFVARKGVVPNPDKAGGDQPVFFIQARPLRVDGEKKRTRPDLDLPELQSRATMLPGRTARTDVCGVAHDDFRGLRLHRVPSVLYRQTHKRAFFEPLSGALALREKFNEPIKRLVARWWPKIETSEKFAQNRAKLGKYHATLKPGDTTLVGLVAEGGQGMRTANNARFLAYLEGTEQARKIEADSAAWTHRWLADAEISPRFRALVKDWGGDSDKPLQVRAAWERAVHDLREEFSADRLGFTKTSLFRISPPNLVAGEEDFLFAWTQRKAALLQRWRSAPELDGFWSVEPGKDNAREDFAALREAPEVTDEDFCRLCGGLRRWVASENVRRSKTDESSIPLAVLGFRSGEDYIAPADAPRIAAIYNGFSGVATFAAFRKGDPEGNRWVDNEPLFVDWSSESVDWLSSNPSARWQGHRFFFTAGIAWSLHANHVAVKARYQQPCVFDASSSRLTPCTDKIGAQAFLAVVNSDVFSFFLKKFIKHNQDVEINDMRQLPLVIPTPEQGIRLAKLTEHAIAAKRHEHAGEHPKNELAAAIHTISQELLTSAPAYLRPSAQSLLLATPADCLSVLERAINWEVEKLYGLEGKGPFNEF